MRVSVYICMMVCRVGVHEQSGFVQEVYKLIRWCKQYLLFVIPKCYLAEQNCLNRKVAVLLLLFIFPT